MFSVVLCAGTAMCERACDEYNALAVKLFDASRKI